MSELLLIANAGDGTISTLRLEREPQPRLEVLATSGSVEGCGTFAIDPASDLVFAAYKGEAPGIATLRLDRGTGRLTELARRATSHSMTYLSLARGGRALLGVSYGGGCGSVWPIDGPTLGDPHSQFSYDNLHCIVAAPAPAPAQDGGEHVYAVSLGEDLIAQFHLADAGLTPLDPPVAAAPDGSGPRHLVIDGDNGYAMTEFSGEAIRFVRGPGGTLTPAEAVDVVIPIAGLEHSTLGADPTRAPLIWGADVHRAGAYLLTSERNSSQLTVTGVSEDGRLGPVLGYTPTEAVPRGFGVSPDGAFVVAVGEASTHAQLLRLGDDGRLEQVDRVGIGRGANWVRFV